jgi:hypothetical protein
MPNFSMQKQSARNLVLSTKIQATQGEFLGDGAMTIRQRFNPSTVFEKPFSRRSDQMSAGKGSEFATDTQLTAMDTKGTLTSEADALILGWMLALLFGVETVTGAGPYTHTFTIPAINATMPPTTIYIEETADQKFEYCDMCASSISITVPERGSVTAALDIVGTGKFKAYTLGSLPALVAAQYLLGSDVQATIQIPAIVFNGTTAVGNANITGVDAGMVTAIAALLADTSESIAITGAGIPANTTIVSAAATTVVISANATAAATVSLSAQNTASFVGRTKGLTIKVDRQAKPFQASGDGLTAGSVASGTAKFSVDFTVAANSVDDVNQWFELQQQLSLTIQTNPANAYGFGFNFPKAFIKASKLTNTEDKVMWSLSFDETCCLQNGGTPAISAFVINDVPAFLLTA